MRDRLRVLIRTPHATEIDALVTAARVPTETGQVGLRPREEPLVLVVEPGLVLLRAPGGLRYAATAGGLLESDREQAVLYTPFAAYGEVDTDVLAALDHASGALCALSLAVAGAAHASLLARVARGRPGLLSLFARLALASVVLFVAARAGHLALGTAGFLAGFATTGLVFHRRLR